MAAQLSSGARVDPLAVIRAHAESHRSRAESDAYSAQEAPKLEATLAAVAELVAAAKRANALVNLLTVRQVIEAGDEAIEAAGLNPYCINEGLAEGDERIGFWGYWHLDAALAPFSEAGR